MYDYQLPDAALSGWLLLARTWSAMYKAEERKPAKVGLIPEQLDILWLSRDYPAPIALPLRTAIISLGFHLTHDLVRQEDLAHLLEPLPQRGRNEPPHFPLDIYIYFLYAFFESLLATS